MDPNEHYARKGHKQGRNIHCTGVQTWFMAKRYAYRYPELGRMYGYSGKDSMHDLENHYYTNGSKQNPKLNSGIAYDSEEPYKCSDYGDECKCKGRIHFGLKFRHDNNEEIETLTDLLDWKRIPKKDGSETKALCTHSNFLGNKGKKIWKSKKHSDLQCFCEPLVRKDARHCAGEGELCECPKGNIFFGAKYQEDSTTRIANFEQMRELDHLARKGAKAPVLCAASSFVGKDPMPSADKDCYCDDEGIVPEEDVTDHIDYHQGIIDEELAAEAEARAEAEAEAAR